MLEMCVVIYELCLMIIIGEDQVSSVSQAEDVV